jgi:heme exporter protein A
MQLVGENLALERGGRLVFSGLSFRAEAGRLLALEGPNGAGKTSLLRLIAGLAEPAAGRLTLEGGDARLTLAQQCHFIAHQEAIKGGLTVAENLAFWAGFYGVSAADPTAALAGVGLAALADYPAQILSSGQRRRLALARLILIPRPLWLLDEPQAGLDQASFGRLSGMLEGHLAKGGLVIAATHLPLGVAGADHVRFAERTPA